MAVEQEDARGAVRVGMTWGGIGGIVGFLASLLGALVGLVIAGFIGVSCGRRAAQASEDRPGVIAGLVGGAVAAPVFVIGASAGAIVGARGFGMTRIAATLSEILGTRVSPDEAWRFFLLSVAFAAVLQAVVLILASAAAGAWATRKK